EVLFTPDFMRRVWFLAPLKFLEEIRSPEEFYLRPLLYREKFPQDRRIEISADLEERIRSQEEAGKLVFMAADPERAHRASDLLVFRRPGHKQLTDLEGLARWVPSRTEGYRELEEAARELNMLSQGSSKTTSGGNTNDTRRTTHPALL